MGKIFKSLVVLTSKCIMVAVVDSNHLVSKHVVATGIQLATLEGVSLPGPLGWPLTPGSRLQ